MSVDNLLNPERRNHGKTTRYRCYAINTAHLGWSKKILAGFQRMVEMLLYEYPINHTWSLHVNTTCIYLGIVDSKHKCHRKQLMLKNN